jgi:nitrogen-specific signal transduction histidine kinase
MDIASETVRAAHGGMLQVASEPEETRFTSRMQLV